MDAFDQLIKWFKGNKLALTTENEYFMKSDTCKEYHFKYSL
jgi:hypothetical protein